MRKWQILLILALIFLLGAVFIYEFAQKDLFIFEGAMREDTKERLQGTLTGISNEIGTIQKKLRMLTARDVIIGILSDFEIEEPVGSRIQVFEKAVQRIPYCKSLQLINMENRIVFDTEEMELAGKPLPPEELQNFDIVPEKGRIVISEEKGMRFLVPCLTEVGRVVGFLAAKLRSGIIRDNYMPHSTKEDNHDFLLLDQFILFNAPRQVFGLKKLEALSQTLQKSNYIRKEPYTFVAQNVDRFGMRMGFVGNRNQASLPGLAIVLLIFLIMLATLFIVFALLQIRQQKSGAKQDEMNVENQERVEDVIDRSTKSASELIREAESMWEAEEDGILQQEASLSPPTLEKVLDSGDRAASMASMDSEDSEDSALHNKEHDATLQNAIDRVMGEKRVVFSSPSGQVEDSDNADSASREMSEMMEKKESEMKESEKTEKKENEEDTLTEDTKSQNDESGILGTAEVEQYWEMISEMLENSLDIREFYLLLGEDQSTYRVASSSSEAADLSDSLQISREEPLFTQVLGKPKVLFLNKSPLNSQTLQKKMAGLNPDDYQQLAIVPVVRQRKGIIVGFTVLLQKRDRKVIDFYSLNEIMYLSML